ncbi:MAG: ABC transporter permease [Vulcanimicrobiaceae bacterium]
MIGMFATFKLALRALLRNKARSLLTMLGVIIGVGAVIVTVAIGAGARISVTQQINSLGSNLLIVMPGSVQQTGARTGAGGASTLTVADGLAIAQLPGVAAVSPSVTDRTQIISQNNNWQTTVTGVAPSYTYIRQWPLASGSFVSNADVTSAAKVAVLGQTVVTNLFGQNQNPLGNTVFINGAPFTVIGVLTPKGQSAVGQDQDDTVLIPYSSALERLTGTTSVGSFLVSASDGTKIDATQQAITQLLEQRHRIVPPNQDDFTVRNLADIAQAASATASIMEYLLAGVAAVSLLVGGIGIMNIMLVSVTERTREIGLRMAVGARGRSILWQFLVEAVVLATIGGAVGVLLGTGGSYVVSLLAHWPTVVPLSAIALAVAFAAAVGMFFGYYPARKASHLNPIEALRFE